MASNGHRCFESTWIVMVTVWPGLACGLRSYSKADRKPTCSPRNWSSIQTLA